MLIPPVATVIGVLNISKNFKLIYQLLSSAQYLAVYFSN